MQDIIHSALVMEKTKQTWIVFNTTLSGPSAITQSALVFITSIAKMLALSSSSYTCSVTCIANQQLHHFRQWWLCEPKTYDFCFCLHWLLTKAYALYIEQLRLLTLLFNVSLEIKIYQSIVYLTG